MADVVLRLTTTGPRSFPRRKSTARARVYSSKSASPVSVTTPSRSASGSVAKPTSAPTSRTRAARSPRWAGVGSGRRPKRPVGSQWSSVTRRPSLRRSSGAMTPPAPFVQSTTAGSPRGAGRRHEDLGRGGRRYSQVDDIVSRREEPRDRRVPQHGSGEPRVAPHDDGAGRGPGTEGGRQAAHDLGVERRADDAAHARD